MSNLFIILIIINISFTFVTSHSYKIQEFEHPLLHNLTESTFDEEIQNENHTPWLIVFYMHTCPYCKTAIDAINKFTDKNKDNDKQHQIKLGKVECDDNMFFCSRFNVTQVPYIVIIQNQKLYECSRTLINEQSISNFITEEKSIDRGKDIPRSIGVIWFLFKSIEDAVMHLDKYIGRLIKRYIDQNIEWTPFHTVGLLIGTLMIIVFIEILCLVYCCVDKNKNNKKETVNDNNQQNDANKIEKKAEVNDVNEDNTNKKLKDD